MKNVLGSLKIVAALVGVCAASGLFAADMPAGGGYSVVKTLKVGGEGGWDYVSLSADGKLLYATRGKYTQVIDAETGAVMAKIEGNDLSHGVALVPELERGFISNGGGATIQIFDLKTNETLGSVKAADDADCILYDAASKHVLTFCGDAGVMVGVAADVDPKSGVSEAPVDLGGKPEFAVSDGEGKVYVNIADKNQVAVVDTKAMKVLAHWPTGSGTTPTGLSMDASGKVLFVGCRNKKLVVMSATDGKVLAELPIGAGNDATAFAGGKAFASGGDGTLVVVGQADGKYGVEQTVKTGLGARTMAASADGAMIYLPTADMRLLRRRGSGRSRRRGRLRYWW